MFLRDNVDKLARPVSKYCDIVDVSTRPAANQQEASRFRVVLCDSVDMLTRPVAKQQEASGSLTIFCDNVDMLTRPVAN